MSSTDTRTSQQVSGTVLGAPGAAAVIAPLIGFGVYAGAATLSMAVDAGQPPDQGFREWAVTFAIAVAGVTIAAWAGVRAVRRGTQARTALVLGVVAVLGVVVFYFGVPCVFGASAAALGVGAARGGRGSKGLAVAGALLGALALVAGAYVMVVG